MQSFFQTLGAFWAVLIVLMPTGVTAQSTPRESQYYKLSDVYIPDSIALEVGGLTFNDEGQLAVSTRQGDIWLIDDPYMKKSAHPDYHLFASGLHEPLGLAYNDGSYYASQRGELTKITDTDGDGKADLFNTVYAYHITGNYHEYAYGPLILPGGDMIITLNLAWTHGQMESLTKWRGWMLKIPPDGHVEPLATGMRSPAGFGLNAAGDLFYAENQGGWIGSGWISHIEKGDFSAHPAGLKWADQPHSPIHDLDRSMFPDSVGTMYNFAKDHPAMKLPAVWFPQGIMGISTSAILSIRSGQFGPFKDQLLVGDEGQSKVMRVFLEKVNGAYQGACFPFRDGFSSGVLRLIWGDDQALFVGMTSRGWPSSGGSMYGLQKLTWTGRTPFEMKTIQAEPYGFKINFTLPVNKTLASSPDAYKVTGFTYIYHKSYGSPIINKQACAVKKAEVSDNGKSVKLYLDGLRAGYIHEIRLSDIESVSGTALLHNFAYYTLNNIPKGGEEETLTAAADRSGPNAPDAKTMGCGQDQSKNTTTQPASWENGPDVTINIGTKPGLKFDKDKFEVKAGSKVQLIFTNDGDMLHNLVLSMPGTLEKVGKSATEMGLDGPDAGYIPGSADIMYNTCLLPPGESQSIYFTAPEKPGDYNYLCTYPGHYVTMNGIMKVVK